MTSTDVRAVFDNMPASFDPDAAQGLDATIEYDITGEGGGTWHLTIADGACQLHEGAHPSPTVRLTMTAATWLAIVNKETNGTAAYMGGQLKVDGDLMLAQRLEKLFPS
jgi:putative sterol carrier protein